MLDHEAVSPAPQPDTDAPEGEEEYTIDEISALAEVPSRTVRFYQSKGALMPPRIKGRVAYYGKAHVERLRLIAQLQDRGLRIDAIRDLFAGIDKGEIDLAEWLGVEQEVQASWANDQPRTMTEAEVYAIVGSRRPGLLAEMARQKILQRHGDVYLVKSPALLAVAAKLEGVGVDMETASQAGAILQKHLARAAGDVLDLVLARARSGHIEAKDAPALFSALRPTGLEAVRVIFGREMERALRKQLESGKLASLPAKMKKKKPAR